MKIGIARLLASTALGCSLPAAAFAADLPARVVEPVPPVFTRLPAVDGVNGKVEAFGGWVDSRFPWRRSHFSGGAIPSVSIPLGQSFGVQADGLIAGYRGRLAGGGAGHLFWRDPSRALVGVYGSAVRVGAFDATVARLGLESALYFDRVTLSGVAGVEWNSGTRWGWLGFAPGGYLVNTGPRRTNFFDMIDLSFYATDDWKLSVGHRYVGGRHAAALGTEALLVRSGGMGLAAFAEGRIGERDYKAALVGVKVYFGQRDKSLIARHRQDDPPAWLKDDLFAASNAARYGALPIPVAAPPISPCPCGPCVD